MNGYLTRIADKTLEEYLRVFGAVVINGARATGKTTTARHFAASAVSLDESPQIAALAQTDPRVIFAGDSPRLIDEWQLAPNVWNAIRHEVDARKDSGQFILTGSATPADDVTRHSGGGRFGRMRLRTLSLFETRDSVAVVDFAKLMAPNPPVAGVGGLSVAEYTQRIIVGGWPLAHAMSEHDASIYLQSYVEDVARVDVGDRTDAERVKALIRAIARNIATERPLSDLAAESEIPDDRKPRASKGLSAPTLRKYLDRLTRIHILEELPPWSVHITSKVRQRVKPKWHFIDPSLAAAALRLSSERLLGEPTVLGFFFESLAIRDLRIYADHLGGTVSSYRDETGLEVDAIVELIDGTWSGFEIKLGGDAHIEEGARNLLKLKRKMPKHRLEELGTLNVLTAGTTSYTRPDGVNVISLGHLKPGDRPS